MTQQEANQLYDQGREAVVQYLVQITTRLQALEARLAQNSQNSSKPPSSDPTDKKPKTTSQRRRTGRKPGGQPGHPGTTLQKVEKPDYIEHYHPTCCPDCGTDLGQLESEGYTTRQVFEMPEPRVQVTEHRAHQVRCPNCGHEARASFPAGVEQPVQYGPNLLGFGTYLHGRHLLPFARAAQVVQDITGAPFGAGTLHRGLREAYGRLASFEQQLKAALHRADKKHADETSARACVRRYWVHVRCTERLTYLFAHARRGKEALADLENYRGLLVSDFFSNYVSLTCPHQFCGEHLCRELQGVFEHSGALWAQALREHLHDCNEACHRARERGATKLWNARALAARFDALVEDGLRATPLPSGDGPRPRRGKARCLLERLRDYRDECLAFLFDLSIPFTNNEAERDLRMFKVRGKISGGFRSELGLVWFCRLRSYLQSCRKQGMDLLCCLRSVFAGAPLLPSFDPA